MGLELNRAILCFVDYNFNSFGEIGCERLKGKKNEQETRIFARELYGSMQRIGDPRLTF